MQTSAPETRTSNLSTLSLVIMLALAGLTIVPMVAAAAGSIKLVDGDRVDVTAAFGSGAVVWVEVTDTDLSSSSTISILVSTTTDPTGELLTLLRDEDGKFRGPFGFEASVVAANGRVAAAAGETVTVRYEDTNPSATVTDALVWNTGTTGTVDLGFSDYYGSAAAAVITVTDNDRNTNDLTAQTVSVHVVDSGGVPIPVVEVVTLTETGANTGIFLGTMLLSELNPSLLDGDTVTVTYRDPYNSLGNSQTVTDTAVYHTTETATITFLNSDYYTLTPATDPGYVGVGTGLGFVRVTDKDQVAETTITANVFSTSDPTGITVTLTSSGSPAGEFFGSFGFDATATGSGVLKVVSGNTVTAKYTDARDATGVQSLPTDTAIWRPRVTGTVEFRNAANTADAPSYTAPATGTIRVTDTDLADTSTPAVRLTSNRDPVGITVTLGATSAGLSVGGFTISATASDVGTIWATADDTLTVTYTDAAQVNGALNVAVTDTAVMSGTTPARPAVDISFKTSATYASVATAGYAGESAIFVEVTGYDDGTVAVDTITAYVGSSDEAVTSGAGPALGGQAVTLTETGLATNIFRGTISLDCTNSGTVLDVPCSAAQVKPATDTLSLQFLDPTGGSPAGEGIVRATIPWAQADEADLTTDLEFRDSATAHTFTTSKLMGLGPAYFVLRDDDTAVDLTQPAETVTVNVKSNTDTTGISVTAKERFGRHGSPTNDLLEGFRGQFTFCTSCTSSDDTNDILRVAAGNTVTLTYTDPRSMTGSASQTFVESKEWVARVTGSVVTDALVYRGGSTATVTLADNDLNTASGTTQDTGTLVTVQSVDVDGNVLETETTALASMGETTADSGVFVKALPFSTTQGTTTDGMIWVKNGATVTVRYSDEDDANGIAQTFTTAFTWYAATATILSLDAASYSGTAATATITLKDPDLDTTTSADTGTVRVFSNSDPVGALITVTETGGATDIFTGTFQFETTRVANNDKVFMTSGDRVTAYFFDVVTGGTPSTDGVIAFAQWTLTGTAPDTTAPAAVTTLATSLPSSVALTLTWTAPADDGSTAGSGNVAGYVFKVATAAFSAFTETANVVPSGVTVPSFTIAAAGQSQSVAISGLTPSTTYYVAVKARDEVPNYAAISNVATGTTQAADTTAPGTISTLATSAATASTMTLTWTAPADDGATAGSGNVTGYVVKVATASFTDFTQVASVLPTGVTVGTITIVAPGASQTVVVSGLSASTDYFFAVKAQDEVPNTALISNVATGTTQAADTTAPGTISTLATSAATASTMTLTWTAPADNGATASSGNVAGYIVKVATASFTSFTQVASVLPTGVTVGTITIVAPGASQTVVISGLSASTEYFFAVKAQDEVPNTAPISNVATGTTTAASTGTSGVTVATIEAANKGVDITVTRDGDDNRVAFDLPNNLPATPAGVQIWRSTSPFILRTTLLANDPEFTAGAYLDEEAPADAKYLVTIFYGLTKALGFSNGESDDIPGFAALGDGTGSGDGDGVANWVWYVVALAAVLIIVLIVFLVVMSRRNKEAEEQPAGEGYAWNEGEATGMEPSPEAAVAPLAPVAQTGDVHHARCPACQTQFTAMGTKPVVTACPGCGKKGVLR